jgi:pimeloyl-ACP methyl ester carboxylesterase
MKRKIHDIELSVHEVGMGEPTLVFLHYWGGSSRTWNEVVARLQNDFRCITYDNRGCGDSEATPTGYSMEDLANDTEALIQVLGLKEFVLVGHSMGGKVAQLVASRQPSGLKALILVAPAPSTPMTIPFGYRKAMAYAYDSLIGAQAVLSAITVIPLSSNIRKMVIEDNLKSAPGARVAWPEVGMMEDISTQIENIKIPTLVLASEKDPIDSVDTLQKAIVNRIEGAQMKIVPRAGHLSPLEAPNEVASEIRSFLTRPKEKQSA